MSAPDGGEQRLSPRMDEGSASTTTVESGLSGWRSTLRNSPQLRRGTVTFLIFALAGSAMTFAVAWACALWAEIPSDVVYYEVITVPDWNDDLPMGFRRSVASTEAYLPGVGVRYVAVDTISVSPYYSQVHAIRSASEAALTPSNSV